METVHVTLLGHKDHGKSTLLGRLLFDTGQAKKDTLETLKEMAASSGKPFEFAHLLDSFMEERANEMTIDTTRATIKGELFLYEIIDVPGHKELIANMLSGASHASSAFLLISAKEGIEEQTTDHLLLAQFLGLTSLTVLINKMDAVSYDEVVFRATEKQARTILKEIGYATDRVAFIPISAREGENLVAQSARMSWYRGATVMDALNALEPVTPPTTPTVFLIQDIHPVRSSPPIGPPGALRAGATSNGDDHIISGFLESGAVQVGDQLTAVPHNAVYAIAKILRGTEEIPRASAGESIGLVLCPVRSREGPQRASASNGARGDVLADTEGTATLHAAKEIKLTLFALKPLDNELIAECGGREARVLTLNPVPKVHAFANSTLSLDAPFIISALPHSLLNKIVLKRREEIAAIGKIDVVRR